MFNAITFGYIGKQKSVETFISNKSDFIEQSLIQYEWKLVIEKFKIYCVLYS